ncbi:MAG: pilus assembly protein [Bifidobacteriaceae bacterium]|jgi:Flp pilus assembly protein TadG|nr:pilus assembly protein [Bifidobacteriaceae bacterium]
MKNDFLLFNMKNERGNATIEFAFIFPAIIGLIVFSINFFGVIFQKITLENVLNDVSRAALINENLKSIDGVTDEYPTYNLQQIADKKTNNVSINVDYETDNIIKVTVKKPIKFAFLDTIESYNYVYTFAKG